MLDNSVYAEAEFRQWVTDGIPEDHQHAETLLALPAEHREPWLASHPEALRYHTFDELIRAASVQLDRDAQNAGALTALIVANVDRVPVPTGAAIARLMMRVNAWRERGNALRNLSDIGGMESAYRRGLELADSDPALAPESAALRRGLALVLYYRGHYEEALAMIRADLPLFREIGDLANLLKSIYFEAYIEYGVGHDEIARDSYADLLAVAEQHGDRMMQARAHLNLGHCTRRLGDRQAAIDHFTASRPLLEECGMTGEIIRVEWGLALLPAIDEPASVLPVLDRFRDEFLTSGRLAEAGWVSLDTLDALHMAGHQPEARRLAIELVDFFASRGMPREALQALADLRDAAEGDQLTSALIKEIAERLGAAFG